MDTFNKVYGDRCISLICKLCRLVKEYSLLVLWFGDTEAFLPLCPTSRTLPVETHMTTDIFSPLYEFVQKYHSFIKNSEKLQKEKEAPPSKRFYTEEGTFLSPKIKKLIPHAVEKTIIPNNLHEKSSSVVVTSSWRDLKKCSPLHLLGMASEISTTAEASSNVAKLCEKFSAGAAPPVRPSAAISSHSTPYEHLFKIETMKHPPPRKIISRYVPSSPPPSPFEKMCYQETSQKLEASGEDFSTLITKSPMLSFIENYTCDKDSIDSQLSILPTTNKSRKGLLSINLNEN
ncbi:putative nuclear formin-like protein MISFIT [Cardiosporidium cionae]|uniref:Nuclear formin-like protein MISFIT n=1 Tax=Cardiosporidium cionae TaxID=476202 RepID=A0ABQ7J5V1_9APIC|nr:putative nuclear formin-like protein MISFIT [Cardiosporidium cionae]|eukprot:KAF8819314.1 putative nuclear formin-like protein MISFIT [Cardiosporidium cionae]